MLKVFLRYKGEQPIFETLRLLSFKYNNGIYRFSSTTKDYTISVLNNASNEELEVSFSGELSFDQYKEIHAIINKLATELHAIIDDHQAFMGYLKDGEKAFLIHNWNEWMYLLEKAKHTSMEGQKVQVYQNQLLIGEGILLNSTYNKSIPNEFQIIECSIISKDGEKVFSGNGLRIVATGEF